jgi:hypothetical protein
MLKKQKICLQNKDTNLRQRKKLASFSELFALQTHLTAILKQ